MPAVKGKSALNLAGSLRAHAADETDYGQDFSRMPGGVTGGIAELRHARLQQYKSGDNIGEQCLYMDAVALSPDYVVETIKEWVPDPTKKGGGYAKPIGNNRGKVQGLLTQQTLPLCPTKNKNGEISADANVAAALNAIRMIGGEGCTAGVEDETSLQAILDALVEQKVQFRFSTQRPDPSTDYPNPIVFHRWHGTKGLQTHELNGEAPEPPAAATVDNSPEAPPAVASEVADETPDLDALATAADNKDKTAAETLKKLAIEAGYEEKVVDDANSWADVVEMIKATANTEAEPEPAADPAVGEMYSYKPPKATKAVQVEVTKVYSKSSTVDLKNATNNKLVYKAVKWDALTPPA